MTSHVGKATMVADAFNNAQNRHDVPKLLELVADNVSYWDPSLPAPITGRKAFENYWRESFKTFPDANVKVLSRITSEDQVVDEVEWTATNKGPINIPGAPAIPATGKRVSGKAVAVARTKDGKVTSLNVYYDNFAMMTQLGLVPQAGSK